MPGGSGIQTTNGVEKKIQMKGPQSWAYDKPKLNASKKVREDAEYSDKEIKMAFGILNDPRYRDGNYDGAYATIEKVAKGLARHPSVSNALKRANESKGPKVREAGSPWTTTGKHPEKMTVDELWGEIAVFDHIQDRGERLTPKDMMRLDSLFSYMDTAEMNEAIKRKADSMMESAVWKAKKNK